MSAPPTAPPSDKAIVDPVVFYDANAQMLTELYESLSFEEIHRELIQFFPPAPAMVLDVGAGSGRDAAALCKRGYKVVAVEPSTELRRMGDRLHREFDIHWIDDRLPELKKVKSVGVSFDVILCSAVWMHLNRQDQNRSMQRLAELLSEIGRLFITFRSLISNDRPGIYQTNPEDIIADASEAGLHLLAQSSLPDAFERAEAQWFSLVFET